MLELLAEVIVVLFAAAILVLGTALLIGWAILNQMRAVR